MPQDIGNGAVRAHPAGPRHSPRRSRRNILVHPYDDIDHEIVAASIGPALEDFERLAEAYARRL
jgi:Protein of unknown function DUF86